jgi:amino acid adenylation domain-containing protein
VLTKNKKISLENMLNVNTKFDPFAGPEIEYIVYTTKAQSEIWTDCYLGGKDAARAYNLSFTIEFNGILDSTLMNQAIQKLIDRHEAFRTTFSTDGVYMSILKKLSVELTFHDLSNLDETAKSNSLEQYIKGETHFLFDLVHGPLIKFGLLKLSATDHQLIFTVHHIICDGWSVGIMLQDLSILYSAYIENKTPILTEPIPFSVYANEELIFSKSDENKEIEKYWFEIYEQSIPVLNLPIENPRPSLRTYKSQRLDFTLDSNLSTSIKKTGLSASASFATTLLTCFEVFLYKLTGQNDIVVGFPSAGQGATGKNHLIGHCVNLLPLRSKPISNISFLDYLKKRKTELFDDYDHQQLSFGQLLQKLKVARDPSRIPLVPVTFNIDMGMTDGVEFSNLTHKFESNPRAFETFEIFLNVSGRENNLVFEWSFNEALFKPETIEQMMISFEKILQKIVEDPSKTINQLIFEDFTNNYITLNSTETPYPNVALAELLSKQEEKTPHNIAIEYNGTKMTYHDLHIKVNQFAHYLAAQGVQSGDYIAVSYPRSPELVYSILAIIQCGAAYLPLDHEYPTKRIEYMLEDSAAKFLVTSKKLALSLPKCSNTILIDDAMASLDQYPETKLERFVNPENTIYLLYTSGSTGKPKGAKITNRNIVNLFCSLEIEPGIKETDRVPFISTISFDIASFELFFPLFKGATLVIPEHETPSDGRLFNEMLDQEKISLVVATPTTYQMLLDSGWSKKLPIKIWCCGEPLPAKLAKELIQRSEELWTLYGPTEVTIFSSCKHIKSEETIISVGGPIANMQYYIVDEHMNLLPPNAIGEIAIGGDGVGKGYLGKPELTASKYIPNIFSNKKDEILYLSGDIGKLLPSNEVMCLGRIDHQVKVRGHRIEIGEIEHALTSIKGIKSAIVLAKTDILVAFIVVDYKITSELDEIRLWRNELASQLPTFMVPHVFHVLEKMPKTLNDKIDRVALLEYKSNAEINQEYTAPRTNNEKLIAEIWQEILKIEKVDIFSNFFELGGYSILAVKVMIKIEKETGKRIPLSSLFQHSTIEKLALLLNTENEIESEHLVPIKPNGSKNPLFMIHGAGLNILNFAHVINHFDEEQPVYGFQGIGPNGHDNWFKSIEEMAACYIESILKINPKGPYAIAGFSFGGIVAFEIARQLKEQGKTVSIIALLDTYVDSSYYYPALWQKKLIRYYDRTYRRLDYLIEMLTSWKFLKLRANAKKEYVLKKYFGINNTMTEQEALALEQFEKASAMVDKITDCYHLKPQNFEVDLFRAKDDVSYKLDATHLGWRKAALKGVNIHNISGNHLEIVEPPNDKILARMLQEILDEKHANI